MIGSLLLLWLVCWCVHKAVYPYAMLSQEEFDAHSLARVEEVGEVDKPPLRRLEF